MYNIHTPKKVHVPYEIKYIGKKIKTFSVNPYCKTCARPRMCACVHACMSGCVCVCVCVRARALTFVYTPPFFFLSPFSFSLYAESVEVGGVGGFSQVRPILRDDQSDNRKLFLRE